MATCSQIAENGCAQPIASDWNYCMRCGALLTKVEIEGDSDLPSATGGRLQLGLLRTGQTSLPISIEAQIVDVAGSDFRLSGNFPISIVKDRTGLVIEYDQPESGTEIGFTLRYRSTGGPRTNGERWKKGEFGKWKSKSFQLALTKQSVLEIVPQAVVFWGEQNLRKVDLRNSGDPLTLGQAQLPIGYKLVDEHGQPISVAGQVVAKGAPATFYLERQNLTASGGQLMFRDEQLVPVGTPLEILSIPDRGIEEMPKFVFGIDFGTSNTSVVARHVMSGVVKAIEYPDPETARNYFADADLVRFPTAILIKGKDPTDLRYGFDALINFVPLDGDVLVTELKSLLRHDTEPYVGISPQLTVDYLLTWYFKKLKQDFVEPYRTSLVGDVLSSDLYIFSLPVLDYATDNQIEYEMQRSRTLRAAEGAGFGDNIRTIHEPVAAALKMLKDINVGDQKLHCAQGDHMVVFDSGGGTTDVAIFTLGFENGKYVMENVEQIGVHRVTVNDEVLERHFGGAVITQDLGYSVCQFYTTQKGLPILQYLMEIEGLSYETFDEIYAFSQEDYLYQRNPSPEEYWVAGSNQRKELAWFKRFVSLYNRVESTKRALGLGEISSLPLDPRINNIMLAEGRSEEEYPTISQDDLLGVLDNHLPELFKSIRTDLQQKIGIKPVKALFVVGGNSILQAVRTGVNKCVDHTNEPQVSDDLRSHAVALGIVESYEPTASVAPYSLKLILRDKNTTIFEASPQRIQRGFKRDLDYKLPRNGKLSIDLYLGMEDASVFAHAISLENESGASKQCTFRVQYDDRSVSISEIFYDGTNPELRFSYEI